MDKSVENPEQQDRLLTGTERTAEAWDIIVGPDSKISNTGELSAEDECCLFAMELLGHKEAHERTAEAYGPIPVCVCGHTISHHVTTRHRWGCFPKSDSCDCEQFKEAH